MTFIQSKRRIVLDPQTQIVYTELSIQRTYDAKDGAEDLLLVGSHVLVHVGDDGGSDKVAVGILIDLCAPSVQQQSGSLING